MSITAAILTAVLTAVDMNANISRVQSDVADLQQSTRAAQRDLQRLVRMAGRGGLPRALAVEVAQADTDDRTIGGENVADGTDILTLRGAFSSPVFRIDASDPAAFQIAGSTATLQIDAVTRSSFDQPLGALHALHDEGTGTTTPDAILLVGAQGGAVYAVAEVTAIRFQTVTLDLQSRSRTVERAILTLTVDPSAGGNADEYLQLSTTPGHLPANLTSVAFASVIEEHRFFIREDFAIPNDATSPPAPKLARARMFPGTDTLHPDGAIDVADNVFDLQVALGVDLDGNGRIDVEDAGGRMLATNADEWLWNDAGDDASLRWGTAALQHVRLTIVGQAQTADRQYTAPALAGVENRDYDESSAPSGAEAAARRYRRRVLQSVVDLRNL